MLLAAIFVFVFFYAAYASTVLSIDFGSDWIKIFHVAPAPAPDPFAIFLDRHGSRKSPSIISYWKDEIQVGSPAQDVFNSKPELAYPWLISNVLGRKADDPLVNQWTSIFKNPVKKLSDNRIQIKMGDDKWVDPEFLVGAMLRDIKDYAEKSLGKIVQGALLVVPSFFGPKQKMALKQAADIAELNVIGVVSSTEAAAIQYMLVKENDKKENVLLLDSGAASTTAVLAEVSKGAIKIKNVVSDMSFSGHSLDLALMERLTAQNKIQKKSVQWYQLLSQVQKTKKTVVTSGIAKTITLELPKGKGPLNFSLTPKDLEEVCNSFLSRLDALLQGKQDVVITPIGSNIRLPVFTNHLAKFKVNYGLNNEEASGRGGAYLAAKLYGKFRIKDFGFDQEVDSNESWTINGIRSNQDNKFVVERTSKNEYLVQGQSGPYLSITTEDAGKTPLFITLVIDSFGLPLVKNIETVVVENEQEKFKAIPYKAQLLIKQSIADTEIEGYKKWLEDYRKRMALKLKDIYIRNELESKMYELRGSFTDENYCKWLTLEEINKLKSLAEQVETVISMEGGNMEENEKLLKDIKATEFEGTNRRDEREAWKKMLETLANLKIGETEELQDLYEKLQSKKEIISDKLETIPLNQNLDIQLRQVQFSVREYEQKQAELTLKKKLEEMKRKKEEEEAKLKEKEKEKATKDASAPTTNETSSNDKDHPPKEEVPEQSPIKEDAPQDQASTEKAEL